MKNLINIEFFKENMRKSLAFIEFF